MWTNDTDRWIIVQTRANVLIAFGPQTGLVGTPLKILQENIPNKAAAAAALLSWRSKTGLKAILKEFSGSAVRDNEI